MTVAVLIKNKYDALEEEANAAFNNLLHILSASLSINLMQFQTKKVKLYSVGTMLNNDKICNA